MGKYDISAFIPIMQSGLIENNKQEAAGRFLIDSIAIGEGIDVSKDMISNLMKQKNEVHSKIKKASARPEVITNAIHYFEDVVLPDLNPHLTDDICGEIIKLLTDDPSVSDKKHAELTSFYQNGKISEFLARSFLYAVSRPNKKVKVSAEVKNDHLNTEFAEYHEFPEVKEQSTSSHGYGIKDVLKKVGLEREIKDVIVALDTVRDVGELEELSLNSLRIDQKILPENTLLLNKLTTNVLQYYYFIRDALSETNNFECIALDIRKAFLKLEKTCQSQDEIIDELTIWIWEQTGRKSKIACEIVVSFFVQNCEVFNEIT